MRKSFESSCGFVVRHLKIRDVCMDLEPCFKVHNVAVIRLKNTKLGQLTNCEVVFRATKTIYQFLVLKTPNATGEPASH